MLTSRASSPKDDQRQVVFGKARHDQLRQRQGHLLGRRDTVLAVQDHAVTDVDHQHRGAARSGVRFRRLRNRLHDSEKFVDAVTAEGVGER